MTGFRQIHCQKKWLFQRLAKGKLISDRGFVNTVSVFVKHGQSDIFYECPTQNVRVPDQRSDKKYKNIHLVDEKKRKT